MRYRPNVSMIVFRKSDDKFLLVHKPRKNHAWQFPQGGVDPGEDNEEAARRELQEELGNTKFRILGKSNHVYFYEFPIGYSRDGIYKGHKQTYFVVEFTGEEHEITLHEDELDDYRWVHEAEIPEYIESDEYLAKLKLVLHEFFKGKVPSQSLSESS
ncbi:MAG: NUDIX domain-containing protein [Candidatus Gracilibacteria bacterium]|nr:NUDIX domain-containing protein [Candidatus Gracilibacteria bacterium]